MNESTIRLLGQLQRACARSPEPLTFIHNGLAQTVVVRIEDKSELGRVRVRLNKPDADQRLREAIAWVGPVPEPTWLGCLRGKLNV